MKNNKKASIPLLAIFVCFIASSFYIYDYILRVLPEALTDNIMQYFNIHAAKFGILVSLFFWGYAPMQIPCGILYDKFSPRLLLTITVIGSALSTIIMSTTSNYSIALVCRFMAGFTTSFAFVGALVVGAQWFRGKYFAMYTGLVQFLGCMGAIIGIAPIAVLSNHILWQRLIFYIGIIGVTLGILIFATVRDVSADRQVKKQHQPLRTIYREAFSHSQTWWTALFGFAIWAPVTIFAVSWGLSFYHSNYFGFSSSKAASLVSVIWWTIAFCGPIVGWVSKRFKTRRIPMFFCSACGLLATLGVLLLPSKSTTIITLLLILFGIGSSGLVISFGLIVDLHPPQAVGAMVGFTNMAVIFGGMTLLPVASFVIQRLWDGTITDGLYVYSYSNYQIALLVVPASFLLALISTFFIRETRCEQRHAY